MKRKQRWHVQIRFHGKQHHLGYFCNLAQAAVVRRKAELKYFGEFAPVELP